MIKRLALLRRRRDLSAEAFGRYWRGPHSDLARAIPHLLRYQQNVVAKVLLHHPANAPAFQVDGLAELWFESADYMAEAFGSPAGRALPEDEAKFLDGITVLAVAETTLRQGGGAAKLFLLNAQRDPAGPPGLGQALVDACRAGGFPEIAGCTVESVAGVFTNPDLWTEPLRPATVLVLRFQSEPVATGFLVSRDWTRLLEQAGGDCKVGALLTDETRMV